MNAASFETLAAEVSVALKRRDRSGFVRSVKKLMDARAPLTRGWKSLTQPLLDYGEVDLALRAIDLYVESVPRSPAALFDRALIYAQASRLKHADKFLDEIDGLAANGANIAYLRGTIALNSGRVGDARDYLIAAHKSMPSSGQVLHSLSMLGSLATDDELAALIMEADQRQFASNLERAIYLFARGKALDDIDDVDGAFAAFREGAELISRQRAYDATIDANNARDAISGWTRKTLCEANSHDDVATDGAIILTGLPRSGSTLLEHVLCSHSAVAGGDELAKFSHVIGEIGGTRYSDVARWLQASEPAIASKLYMHLLHQRVMGPGKVVDKTLGASRYLGTLAAIMPDAPILWMRRDALDVAWSCYSTYFAQGLSWSFDQRSIASHMALESQLLDYWSKALGDRLMICDYEKIVTIKEEYVPAVLSHCRLPMEVETLSPDKVSRTVQTASAAQVRQPIHTRSLGRGKRYRRHLDTFARAYGYQD